ncbi:Smr/MutS family protein [Flavobacteriales bacterium]|nr:Smr/MutS family protein [Flavobacteriales bacterium]
MYQIKDEVTFLDEVGVYKIIEVLSSDIYIVEDEHGFDRKCSVNEITLYKKNAFDGVEIETFENRNIKVNPFANKNKKGIQVPIVDLHMEKLMNSHSHMSNHQIVLFQLDFCKREIDKHINKGTREFVIIHGVGNGKLKEEVRYLLHSYPALSYMDNHYSPKGMGATKVFIK